MSQTVKFYGGPLHGQHKTLSDGQHRIQCRATTPSYRPARFNPWDRDAPPVSMRDTGEVRDVSYEILRYNERRGNCYRVVHCAVLEGEKNILDHERWEMEREIDKIPWQIYDMPSFLCQFDRWWNCKMYQLTGRQEFLREELCHTLPKITDLMLSIPSSR